MDTTSTTTMATYSAAASSAVAAANNWATVERELPSLTGPSASQPWQLAQGAAVQAASEAAAVPYFAGGPLGVPLSGGWSGASAAERTASRGGAGRHPWEVDSSQLCRSDEVHEVTLPDYSARSGGKSGGCGCGGSCGGKCGGSCGQKPHRDSGMDGGARPAGHGTGRASGNPYVLDDPRHDLVLLAQELLLLEGHLADPERRCPSCVGKHALTARGLADEGRRLDGGGALGPVWSAVLGLGLGADAQAVRAVRQGVVGRIVALGGRSSPRRAATPTPLASATGAFSADADGNTQHGWAATTWTGTPANPFLKPCPSGYCGPAHFGSGTCGCRPGYACRNNRCVCQPQCAGKQCAADGCGGSCGGCATGLSCQSQQCLCPGGNPAGNTGTWGSSCDTTAGGPCGCVPPTTCNPQQQTCLCGLGPNGLLMCDNVTCFCPSGSACVQGQCVSVGGGGGQVCPEPPSGKGGPCEADGCPGCEAPYACNPATGQCECGGGLGAVVNNPSGFPAFHSCSSDCGCSLGQSCGHRYCQRFNASPDYSQRPLEGWLGSCYDCVITHQF